MKKIKFIELDVLKPNKLNVLDLAKEVASIGESYSVSINVMERDRETESTQMFIEANDIDYDKLIKKIENSGATVHSIDTVGVGPKPTKIWK
jgi:hypothetical protein